MAILILSAELPFTAFMNRAFGGVATSLMEAVGVHPHHPGAPFSNWMAMQILVFVIMLAIFVVFRTRISVERPGAIQHIFEGIEGFVTGQSEEVIGHHSKRYTPFLMTLGLFILFANLIGMIPGFESPTANQAVPLGLAIMAFLYYNMNGVREQGLGKYLKHFMGPMPALAPIMIPVEIVSHFARVMSLTIRLYANIFAGDMVTLVFFSLIPVVIPVVFLGLHVAVSFLQAYIFVLLTTIYLAGAVSHEEGH